MSIDKDHSGLAKFNKIDDPELVKIFMIIRKALEHSKLSLYFRESRKEGSSFQETRCHQTLIFYIRNIKRRPALLLNCEIINLSCSRI